MNKKVIIIFLGIILLSFIIVIPVFAAPPGASQMQDISNPWSGNTQLRQAGNSVLGIIQIFGSIFAVGTFMLMGIKYMMAAPEEKAEVKKSVIPYLIGATLVFAAVNVVKLVADFAGKVI